jgi:hypothetical protein
MKVFHESSVDLRSANFVADMNFLRIASGNKFIQVSGMFGDLPMTVVEPTRFTPQLYDESGTKLDMIINSDKWERVETGDLVFPMDRALDEVDIFQVIPEQERYRMIDPTAKFGTASIIYYHRKQTFRILVCSWYPTAMMPSVVEVV